MKKLKLNLFFTDLAKKVILPALLLVGLVFASATSVSAQTYKSAESASILVKLEVQTARENSSPAITDRTVNGVSPVQNDVNLNFYSYLLNALGSGDTQIALDETIAKLSVVYAAPEVKPYFLIAKQGAIALITE